ncbi:MAG TPA: anhydro-N-acetylmuramic acid kinase [Chitinophagaceae bacterium]|nr:anhydro-N-acetylmuramic acid kinase [Chitinophagaceae bacterium]
MQYRAIGLMSGSSLDGLDIVYTELEETGGKWTYEIKAATCIEYDNEWLQILQRAEYCTAYEYLLLHTDYGKFIAEKVNDFIDANDLHHKVQMIASHGHTVFHAPQLGITAQLGDGATIAALTGINVVSDLRIMDIALGGQGAPIVPMGEKLLLKDYNYFLNIGGIANISANLSTNIAFDVCPANRVLNMLANREGKAYDDKGQMAKSGFVSNALLAQLNNLDYYKRPYPKSLANDFGTEVIFPLIQSSDISTVDALRTYAEHIVQQVVYAVNLLKGERPMVNGKLLVTGGGAFNDFLIERMKDALEIFNIDVIIPDDKLVQFKEAMIMALLGVLRWREEDTVMNTVTGASRSSIGGAVWIGLEA